MRRRIRSLVALVLLVTILMAAGMTAGATTHKTGVTAKSSIASGPSSEISEALATEYSNGHKYLMVEVALGWEDARKACENAGGHLATITSAEEQAFIEQLIANGSKHQYWIGGTDRVKEGEWEWVTGEPFEYTNWDHNQPDDGEGQEDSLQILRVPNGRESISEAFRWNDMTDVVLPPSHWFSRENTGFICEWDSTSPSDFELTKDQLYDFAWEVLNPLACAALETGGRQTLTSFEIVPTQMDGEYWTAFFREILRDEELSQRMFGEDWSWDISGSVVNEYAARSYLTNAFGTLGTAMTSEYHDPSKGFVMPVKDGNIGINISVDDIDVPDGLVIGEDRCLSMDLTMWYRDSDLTPVCGPWHLTAVIEESIASRYGCHLLSFKMSSETGNPDDNPGNDDPTGDDPTEDHQPFTLSEEESKLFVEQVALPLTKALFDSVMLGDGFDHYDDADYWIEHPIELHSTKSLDIDFWQGYFLSLETYMHKYATPDTLVGGTASAWQYCSFPDVVFGGAGTSEYIGDTVEQSALEEYFSDAFDREPPFTASEGLFTVQDKGYLAVHGDPGTFIHPVSIPESIEARRDGKITLDFISQDIGPDEPERKWTFVGFVKPNSESRFGCQVTSFTVMPTPEDDEATHHIRMLIRDSFSGKPIEGAQIAEKGIQNSFVTSDSDGLVYIKTTSAEATAHTSLCITADGYEPFEIQWSDLRKGLAAHAVPDNYIALTPLKDRPPSSLTPEDRAYIESHLRFYNDVYLPNTSVLVPFSEYWRLSDKKAEKLGYSLWETLDMSNWIEIPANAVLKGEGIKANYFDLYLADLLLALTKKQESELPSGVTTTKDVLSRFQDVRDATVNGFGAILYDTLNDPTSADAISAALVNVPKDTPRDTLVAEFEKMLSGETDKMKGWAKESFENVFEAMEGSQKVSAQVFQNLSKISDYSSTLMGGIKDGIDGYSKWCNAAIVARAAREASDEIFEVLDDTARRLNNSDFTKTVQKYREKADLAEVSTVAEFATDDITDHMTDKIKDVTGDFIASQVSNALGLTTGTVKALIAFYKATYAIADSVTKVGDKGEAFFIQQYNMPVEEALHEVVNAAGRDMQANPESIDAAVKFDAAFRTYRETNVYLYKTMYSYASKFTGKSRSEYADAAEQLMRTTNWEASKWKRTYCHGYGVPSNRVRGVHVQCPVDVEVYDPDGTLIMSVIDENTEINTDSLDVSVMVANTEKSFILPSDKPYRIVLTARESCLTTYGICEYEDEQKRNIEFYDVELQSGETLECVLPDGSDLSFENYVLSSADRTVQSSYDSNAAEETCPDGNHTYSDWKMGSDGNVRSRRCDKCGKMECELVEKQTDAAMYSILSSQLALRTVDGEKYLVGLIIGETQNNTEESLRATFSLAPGTTLTFLGSDDSSVQGSGLLGSGTLMRFENSSTNAVEEIYLVVGGDVLGSGTIGLAQLVTMARIFCSGEADTGWAMQAADLNANGRIDLSDLVREAAIFLGGR